MGIADLFRTWSDEWSRTLLDERIVSPKSPEFAPGMSPEKVAGLPWKAHEAARGVRSVDSQAAKPKSKV